jgi:hypothetical protein
LSNFIPPINPLESIIGMGQLTALSELGFIFPKGCASLEKVACMEALSTSLEKLINLRKLQMSYDEVAWRVDVLSSLSPPFYNLEELNMNGCTFSRVPRWLGHLHNLRNLSLGVKQMVQEDFAIIGRGAPSLLSLTIRIAGILTEMILIRGSMGFASVKYFEFRPSKKNILSSTVTVFRTCHLRQEPCLSFRSCNFYSTQLNGTRQHLVGSSISQASRKSKYEGRGIAQIIGGNVNVQVIKKTKRLR